MCTTTYSWKVTETFEKNHFHFVFIITKMVFITDLIDLQVCSMCPSAVLLQPQRQQCSIKACLYNYKGLDWDYWKRHITVPVLLILTVINKVMYENIKFISECIFQKYHIHRYHGVNFCFEHNKKGWGGGGMGA